MKTIWYVKAALVLLLVIASGVVLMGMLPENQQPEWLRWATNRHITKGLDLQGGFRLVYRVEVDQALRDKRDRTASDMVEALEDEHGVKDAKIHRSGEGQWTIVFAKQADLAKVDGKFLKRYRRVVSETHRDRAKSSISFTLDRKSTRLNSSHYS